MHRCLACLLIVGLCIPAFSQKSKKSTVPVPGVSQPATPDLGPAPTISINVDATDAPRKVFHAKLTIPASSGTLTLYYPKWIPGEHGPTGPVVDTAGLFFTGAGKPLQWKRDTLDMYTYLVQVPEGVTSVQVEMDYLSPVEMPSGFSSASSATSQLAVLSWNWLTLYPKGWSSDQIQVKASLKLPQGWDYGTALPIAKQSSGAIDFAPASLTTVVDSPVIMGSHLKKIQLQSGKTPAHELDVAADSDAALQLRPDQLQGFDNLVAEAGALFGARHYRGYHFLLSLSDHVAHFGLEHHESNDSRLGERYFTDPTLWTTGASLLPHEYTHSWNGKYRRPFDLATPEYETPMQGELLWVYEGMTEYIGYLLAARSGLWTADQWRDQMALIAGIYSHRPGRRWRSLEDTATAAQLLYGASPAFENWRRSVDYYDEGALIWLEADVIIRQQTKGQKTFDDFTHLFHGAPDSGPMVRTYTFDDVVNTLNQVAPYDWRKFLTDRILNVAPLAPLGGIEQGGWKVVYTDKPNAMEELIQKEHKILDCGVSVGLFVNDKGILQDVIHDSAAYKAGLAPGMKIIAVNSRKFSTDGLQQALLDARQKQNPIQLIVENTEYYMTVALDYHDGPQYAHLIRDESKPDLLNEIIKPKVTTPPKRTPEADIK